MRTAQKVRSDHALDMALAEIGSYPRTALIVLFFAVARRLSRELDREIACGLAYKVADEMATGEPQ